MARDTRDEQAQESGRQRRFERRSTQPARAGPQVGPPGRGRTCNTHDAWLNDRYACISRCSFATLCAVCKKYGPAPYAALRGAPLRRGRHNLPLRRVAHEAKHCGAGAARQPAARHAAQRSGARTGEAKEASVDGHNREYSLHCVTPRLWRLRVALPRLAYVSARRGRGASAGEANRKRRTSERRCIAPTPATRVPIVARHGGGEDEQDHDGEDAHAAAEGGACVRQSAWPRI